MAALDWSQCSAVESVPGKVSGAWVLKGTRMPVSAIFENREAGLNLEICCAAHSPEVYGSGALGTRRNIALASVRRYFCLASSRFGKVPRGPRLLCALQE